jgi:ornithine carbamoyltransferase
MQYMKDLLSMEDFSIKGLIEVLALAKEVKNNPEAFMKELEGRSLVMIFEKPSTRTRVSFECAILQLGGHAVNITRDSSQLNRGETLSDSAKTLERYVNAIVARVNNHNTLLELSANAKIPVINGLSDIEHPCQIIADLLTIQEEKGGFEDIKVAYVGDGNNVCNSLLLGCAMTGINISAATPKEYKPRKESIAAAQKITKDTGAKIEITTDPADAVKNADFVYTDVWVSMGDESEEKERIKTLKPYQVNEQLLGKAKKGAKIMHCLPAHRGLEITGDVLDGPQSIVWNQAENRLHAQKAILLKLL